MKVIKQGNYDLKQTKRFHCKNCGCIFEADKSEYKDYVQYNQTEYLCECPTCHSNTASEPNYKFYESFSLTRG